MTLKSDLLFRRHHVKETLACMIVEQIRDEERKTCREYDWFGHGPIFAGFDVDCLDPGERANRALSRIIRAGARGHMTKPLWLEFYRLIRCLCRYERKDAERRYQESGR